MNNIEMLKQMLIMQDEINSNTYGSATTSPPWHRAIWIECAELIDHHGYKWWKSQEPDWGQITLEIVDIWHFGMSMLLEIDFTVDELADDLLFHYDTVVNNEVSEALSFVEKVEVLAGTAITGIFDTISFFDIMLTANIDLDMLFSMYIGKNVLNKFRQANGYKQGEYIKIWHDGREDNEHLTDIMMILCTMMDNGTIKGDEIITHIMEALQRAYDITIKNIEIEISHIQNIEIEIPQELSHDGC